MAGPGPGPRGHVVTPSPRTSALSAPALTGARCPASLGGRSEPAEPANLDVCLFTNTSQNPGRECGRLRRPRSAQSPGAG